MTIYRVDATVASPMMLHRYIISGHTAISASLCQGIRTMRGFLTDGVPLVIRIPEAAGARLLNILININSPYGNRCEELDERLLYRLPCDCYAHASNGRTHWSRLGEVQCRVGLAEMCFRDNVCEY